MHKLIVVLILHPSRVVPSAVQSHPDFLQGPFMTGFWKANVPFLQR